MKKTVFIIFLATWNTFLAQQKSADIIIKNETKEPISIMFDGRVDNCYTHASEKTNSLIPCDELFYVEQELDPGKTKEVTFISKQISEAHQPHNNHLLKQNYCLSHKTVRGTLVVTSPKEQHYDLQENILSTQDLTLTVTRDGLTVEIDLKPQAN